MMQQSPPPPPPASQGSRYPATQSVHLPPERWRLAESMSWSWAPHEWTAGWRGGKVKKGEVERWGGEEGERWRGGKVKRGRGGEVGR